MSSRSKNWEQAAPGVLVDFEGARRSRQAQSAHEAKRKARKAARPQKAKKKAKAIPAFYSTEKWIRVRYAVLQRDGAQCACCGRTKADGVVMNVDHIKPRWKFPELQLDMNNLQVLCNLCNQGKGGFDRTDWRTKS